MIDALVQNVGWLLVGAVAVPLVGYVLLAMFYAWMIERVYRDND